MNTFYVEKLYMYYNKTQKETIKFSGIKNETLRRFQDYNRTII